jgi:hypothetical protein
VNLLKSKLRRTSAVVAGSIIGLAGVAVFAAPASAHAPTIDGTASCVSDKGWTVDWSVGNDFDLDATVTSVTATDQSGKELKVTGALAESVTVPANSDDNAAGQVKGATEVTDEDVTAVTLTVILKWSDGYTNDGQSPADVQALSRKGGHNGGGGKHNGPPLTKTVDKGEKCTSEEPPATTEPTPTPTETTPTLPVPTPSTTDEPGEFTPIIEEDCDTITIGIDNPSDGLEWKLTYETSKGEKREVTVKPGEKKTETFSAKAGFSIKLTLAVTYEGETYSDYTTIEYQGPGDCSGEGGGLPVTGAAAGGIAGGAAVLLALGALLFVMARRRKLKFTA